MKKTTIALGLALAAIAASAFGASTINPNVPAPNSPLASGPIRSNFAAAYSDVNNILGAFAGTSAPANPIRFQNWMDTTTAPFTLKIYDGAQWVSTGKLNGSSHVWNPIGTYAGAPIGTTYGGLGGDFSAATGALFINSGTVSAGTLPAAFVPAPTLIALGGIKALGAVTHNFLTGLDTSGNLLAARPACGDLSDGVSSCHVDTTNAANIGSGTLSYLRLPTPTLSTIGAVKAFGPTSHTFITTIATDGSITGAQPACADLSNAVASCSTDATNATNISTGTLPDGRFPATLPAASGVNLTALNATNLASGTVASARVSGSYTGITGTGTLAAGSTGAGFTLALGTSTMSGVLPAANGGAGTISGALKGNGSGTVSQAACADLSNGATGCSTAAAISATGTWTPVLKLGATTATISVAGATYTTFSSGLTVAVARIDVTNKNSGTGAIIVTGLPTFNGQTYQGCSINYYGNFVGITGNVFAVEAGNGSTEVDLSMATSTGNTALLDTNFGANAGFGMTCTYYH